MDGPLSLEARRVDLALAKAFRLGGVTVDPAAHELAWGDTSRRLQPQTLKVLVALHDKIGQVVPRQQLIDRCWDGRFVGDDVINRCISLLRRIAMESGGIEIQTIPRGGYRLLDASQAADLTPDEIASAPARPLAPRPQGLTAFVAALGLLIAAGGGIFLYQQLDGRRPDAVMLKPFQIAGSAAAARTMAAAVPGEVAGALAAAGLKVVHPDAAGSSDQAAFVLGGRVELTGPDLHLTADLEDARDHLVLWSTTFTRPAVQMQAMQEQVSANLAAVLHCALDTSRDPHEQLAQDTIKLYLKACALQQAVDPPEAEIVDLLKQVTGRQPRFATAWARLALAAAEARFLEGNPSSADALRREASAAARVALRLDPNSGLAHEALINMKLGRAPFEQLHREIRAALSLDPRNADLTNDDGELMMRMGSLDQALEMFRRGVEMDPLSPAQVSDLINELINDSRNTEAQATLQRALRIWPDDNNLRIIRLDYEARFGSPASALAILKDPDARPQKVHDITLEAYRRLAETRRVGRAAETKAFIVWLKEAVASGQLGIDFAAPRMAAFGDVDGAFRLAFASKATVPAIDPEFLWEPESVALRRDRRFVALAAKFHVADFWRTTGIWPDFCATPDWPYSCKKELSLVSLQSLRDQP